MTTSQPICPPIPTREEFNERVNTGYYEEVDLNNVKQGDIILMDFTSGLNFEGNSRYFTCLEIVNPKNDEGNPEDWIRIRFLSNEERENEERDRISVPISKKYLMNLGRNKFYRINERKNFDKVANEYVKVIREKPIDAEITPFDTIMDNEGLRDNVGQFLGSKITPKNEKGGRRKKRGTKRTRRNKRKGTRRIRRK
jgi:hypothetical protein